MSYTKHNFQSGAKLYASQLNEMDEQIESLSDFVTPEEFGAVGDGVADDRESIQDAIDYAREHGINVKFGRNKTYSLNSGICIKQGVSVDMNGSTLWRNFVLEYFELVKMEDNTSLFNGVFNGINRGNRTSINGNYNTIEVWIEGNMCEVHHMDFYPTDGTQIGVKKGNNRIHDNYFRGGRSHAVYAKLSNTVAYGSTESSIWIYNNLINMAYPWELTSANDAIKIVGMNDIHVTGNTVICPDGGGINIEGQFMQGLPSNGKISITDNYIEGKNGLYMYHHKNDKMDAEIVRNSIIVTQAAIHIPVEGASSEYGGERIGATDADRINFHNNYVEYHGKYAAINMEFDNAGDVSITDNYFKHGDSTIENGIPILRVYGIARSLQLCRNTVHRLNTDHGSSSPLIWVGNDGIDLSVGLFIIEDNVFVSNVSPIIADKKVTPAAYLKSDVSFNRNKFLDINHTGAHYILDKASGTNASFKDSTFIINCSENIFSSKNSVIQPDKTGTYDKSLFKDMSELPIFTCFALPEPNEYYRGRIALVKTDGNADALYVCMFNGTDFEWKSNTMNNLFGSAVFGTSIFG